MQPVSPSAGSVSEAVRSPRTGPPEYDDNGDELLPLKLRCGVRARGRGMRRVVVYACFTTFAMGGVVFGISSLYPLLYSQGFYRTVCHVDTDQMEQVCAAREVLASKCCDTQFVRFSLVASGSFFLVDAAAAPWGELADRAGGRICLLIATIISVSGFVLLSLGSLTRTDSPTTFALMLLGFAGPGAFNGGYIGSLELIGDNNAELKSLLTSFSAAAFDGSALVFMLFQGAAHLLFITTPSDLHGLAVPSMLWAIICTVTVCSIIKHCGDPSGCACRSYRVSCCHCYRESSSGGACDLGHSRTRTDALLPSP